VPDKITFYAVIGGGPDHRQSVRTGTRLEFDGDGFTDEDCGRTSAGSSRRRSWIGSADLDEELVEVSHEQAEEIIKYFRERWGPFGQPLDP
jgi:hypothetical protein